MFGQELQRFERASTWGIVFEIVGIDIDLLEELDSDTVVATLREVHAVLQRHQDLPVGNANNALP